MPEQSLTKARERRDYERTASIISAALAVVGSSDLAMRGLAAAVKRTAKSPQQNMIAELLKNYTAPGNPGNTFFKNIRHLHPNVRKRYVAGMMANFFMRDPEFNEVAPEEQRHQFTHGHPHQPHHALQPEMRGLLRGRSTTTRKTSPKSWSKASSAKARRSAPGCTSCWAASPSYGGPCSTSPSAIPSRCSWCSPTPP